MPKLIVVPELILERDAMRVLIEWQMYPHKVRAVAEHAGKRVTITVEPIHVVPLFDMLSECERDIMSALKSAGQRLTRPQIVAALDAAGQLHGDSTIRNALARLVRAEILDSPGVGKRGGYGLAQPISDHS
jgi:tRNA A-37 threonylcarbamoyl transferase component Bud32